MKAPASLAKDQGHWCTNACTAQTFATVLFFWPSIDLEIEGVTCYIANSEGIMKKYIDSMIAG